jgi:hypothetical protein
MDLLGEESIVEVLFSLPFCVHRFSNGESVMCARGCAPSSYGLAWAIDHFVGPVSC